MKLNVGCGEHYAPGWVNTDVIPRDPVVPDLIVPRTPPWPIENNAASAVYLGHVLEHIAWPYVGDFLAEVRRIATGGAPVMAAGPDVWRTLVAWKRGQVVDELVQSVLEHQEKDPGTWAPDTEDSWSGGPHYWNSSPERIADQLTRAGFEDVAIVSDEAHVPVTASLQWGGIAWPAVNYTPLWQCAVFATAP